MFDRILAAIISILLSVFIFSPSALSQTFPTADYAAEIPTLKDEIGHNHGEEITSVSQINQYMKALEAAAPNRAKVFKYAESWQGRELFYAIISSPENIARLDEIRAETQKLARGDRAVSTDEIPAVVWLSYGVHGDEISPPDSALFIAYHLLAAKNDPLVEAILDDVIVIIDPLQNPDGRARFIHSFESARGLKPQSDRFTAEHDQPWPRGRYNHYLFDLNRDWFSQTQPETKGKVKAVLEWNPVVYVDSHEMGGDSTYYFPPPAKPLNPYITELQRKKQVGLGQNHAKWFDEYGVPYFTREVYDAFYPGYGDMWPTLNGAIAQTFEQASARGLIFDREDESVLTYADGVRNNALTTLSTLQVVAENKSTYLKDLVAYKRNYNPRETGNERYLVLDLSFRKYEAEQLAQRLITQGIEVKRSEADSRFCGRTYKNGALIVDFAQPQGRLAATLLTPSTPLAPEFIADQESRRERSLHHELYDVTAWSLPLMDGLKYDSCNRANLRNVKAFNDVIPTTLDIGDPSFGIAAPWIDGGQARLVIDALKKGLIGKSTDTAFTKEDRVFPAGTVIFPSSQNPADYAETLKTLASEYGATLIGMEDSWVEVGPNFGSRSFVSLKLPKVAMLWGEGTRATSAGNTRFVIEQQLGLAVAPIRLSSARRADLSLYDVLIIPDVSDSLPMETLRSFVENGGVIIGFERALLKLAGTEDPLIAAKVERLASATSDSNAEGSSEKSKGTKVPGKIFESKNELKKFIEDPKENPEDVPGVIAKVEANTDHWLSAGYDSANVLVTGRNIFQPLNSADGDNVFSFASADELLLSGYLWEENRRQLAFKPYLMTQNTGDGIVIGFAYEPTTRAYLNGLNLVLANAVLFGPPRASD